MMSLPVWMPGPMFLLGESLSRGSLSWGAGGVSMSRGCLCPGGFLSGGFSGQGGLCVCVQGISVQEGLCPGGSLSMGSLSGRPPRQRPMYGEVRAVHILLEFFLVSDYILVEF